MSGYPFVIPLVPHDLSLEEIAYVNDTKRRFVELLAVGRTVDGIVLLGRSSAFFEQYSRVSQDADGLVVIGNREKTAESYAHIVKNNNQHLFAAIKGIRAYQGSLDEIHRVTGARVTMVDTGCPGAFVVCRGYMYEQFMQKNRGFPRTPMHADTVLFLEALRCGANAIAHYARMWKDDGLEVIGTPIFIDDRRKQR